MGQEAIVTAPSISVPELVSAYLNRPRYIAYKELGQWFCDATGIKDKDLPYLNQANALRHIENAGYLYTPRLFELINSYHVLATS